MINSGSKKDIFIKLFGNSNNDILTFFAPGRVNLIGEHIDYNGGFVFPAALSIGIYGFLRYRNDEVIRLRSENIEGEISISLQENIFYNDKDSWGNYPKGVIKYLLEDGHGINGCDLLFSSTLPVGAGLSSSAAMEVLTGYMMLYKTMGKNIDRIYLAKLCKSVENQFIKVNCGIMDQFSIALGKKNQAILLDCNTLDYKYIPFFLKNYSLIIINTNKKRELSASKYNERRQECEKALAIIQKFRKVENLCQVNLDEIYEHIKDETLIKRARHVISENQRVLKAVDVLNKGELSEFGELLIDSHMSLKNDYEVTGLELDTVIDESLMVHGCIGGRMTGAGFGGCAIVLVENTKIDTFKEKVSRGYTKKTGLMPDFYVSVIEDGVNLL